MMTDTVRTFALSNGRYSVLLTPGGTGGSYLDGLALTRWQPHPVRAAGGLYVYLRDADSGRTWSAAGAPIGAAGEVDVAFDGRVATFDRVHEGIASTLRVFVAAGLPLEVRELELHNRSGRERTIEVTSCAELVLNTAAGDAAHPAFSKLFVQTAFDAAAETLIAWRRLRSPEDRPLWAAHRLIGPGELQYETDRARFLGRGRSYASPAALGGVRLSGSTGNVIDPLLALRRSVRMGAGERVRLTLLLAGGSDRAEVQGALSAYATGAFEASELPADAASAAASVPVAWLRHMAVTADAFQLRVPPSPAPAPRSMIASPLDDSEPLRCYNGLGGFTQGGDEYVIRVRREPGGFTLPPQPWVNVIANEQAGFLISERGAGYTWAANSRENRITAWSNDPIADPHSDAIYVRDDETGRSWSLTPGPRPGDGDYEVRHGIGYTRFRHRGAALEQELCCFMPRDLPVRVQRIRITNRSARSRRISLWSCAGLVLGVLPVETAGTITTTAGEDGALRACNPERGEFSGRIAFSALQAPASSTRSWTTDGREFTGPERTLAEPAAVEGGEPLAGASGSSLDPCFAHQAGFELESGQTLDAVVLLGEAADEEGVRACLERIPDADAADAELIAVIAGWRELLGRLRIQTPSPAIDLMVNDWLPYQNLSCRIWGRSAFFQSGGAYGFRDQLQDAAALLYLAPGLTRAQLLLNAAHQFVEGDVLHWWHPPLSKGMRTRFADDLLWLPYLAAYYANATGDHAVFDEVTRFLHARPLESGEDEVYLVPEEAGESATLYEHCCRALDRSLTHGAHGLPLMGVGDWNDGMNRVGREGKGESVWLGFFLFEILDDFIAICAARGDTARVQHYGEYMRRLGTTLNDTGWDGEWYRRAYYDSGAPLGSAENDECRIDTIAQAWSVISGAAPHARAEQALDAMERHLVSERERIIRLLTPAFDRTPHDPGYIKGYLPGVRENGGQYTHGALWGVRALAELGRGERAARLLELLSPVSHALDADSVTRYQVEPYVIAADVYGVEPHVGRGGWTWYTGSAGWMYRVAVESILGLDLRGGRELWLRPCIPAAWPGFRVRYTSGQGAVYDIRVERGTRAVTDAYLGSERLDVRDGAVIIPLREQAGEHVVHVQLGEDAGPRYECRLSS